MHLLGLVGASSLALAVSPRRLLRRLFAFDPTRRHRRRSPASQGFATTSRSHPVMVIASAHDAYDAYDAYALTNEKQTRDFDTLKTQFKHVQKIPIGPSSYLSVEV